MRFDMMGFLRGLDCGKNGETTVMIGNSGNKKPELPSGTSHCRITSSRKALISKTRLLSENRRKGRVVQAGNAGSSGPCAIKQHHYRKMNIQQSKWLIVTVCDGKLNWL